LSAKSYISQAGVTRFPKKIYVSDAGAVVRRIKKQYISDSGGVTRLTFTGADYLSLVAGTAGGSNGYTQGSFGSLTPGTLGDGATVIELAASATSPHPLVFFIDTYPGTITSSYLTSVTIGAAVFLATAATFSGGTAGGSASWTWASGPVITPTDTYAVAVQRS
jgi:hypothetical protein